MSEELVFESVKETLHSIGTAIGLPAVATAAVITVVLLSGSGSGPWNGRLDSMPFQGDVARDWSDAFSFASEPKSFAASMRKIAEAASHQFRAGTITISVSTLRADGETPCLPMITLDGETPRGWGRSVCPMRIVVRDEKKGTAATVKGMACMPPADASEQSRTNAVVDIYAGIVTLTTVRDGQPEPTCDRIVHLPTPGRTSL